MSGIWSGKATRRANLESATAIESAAVSHPSIAQPAGAVVPLPTTFRIALPQP